MTGLQSTNGYDKSEMTKINEMLKTGQVPMDVNAMPGLLEDVSDAEELDAERGINALQGRDVCYFCKKPGHQKRDCRKFDEWKRCQTLEVYTAGCWTWPWHTYLWSTGDHI